jgi:hypothetical protein
VKAALWRKLAAVYLVPALPGGWHADGWVLHGEPREWYAPALVVSVAKGGRSFSLNAISQFLAVPRDYWTGDSLEAIEGPVLWDAPSTADEAGPVMAEALRFATERALPFLDRAATVDGHLAYLRKRAAAIDESLGGDRAWQDVNVDEEFCYAHLIAGDRAAASQYAEYAARTAEVDPRPWAQAARERVARVTQGGLAVLREQADHTRTALRVPS